MTLIVGIRCRDGIVMGSDGAATMGALGQHTARQSVKKLTIIDDRIIFGASGPVGLSQIIAGRLTEFWRNKNMYERRTISRIMEELRNYLWQAVKPAFETAQIASGVLGPVASESVLCSFLVATNVEQKAELIQFTEQCAPERTTEDLPFVAIGSGQTIADPFLAFLRRNFWPDTLPSISDGVFATYWTLDHAIKTSPGGVADPKQVIVFEPQGGGHRPRELSSDELQEIGQAVEKAEKQLADFRLRLMPTDQDVPPPVPGST